jgi:hypothetical protein
MALVEVRLHSFLYRFRRLTWREEASVHPADGEDYRDAVLATALTDISGLKATSLDDALGSSGRSRGHSHGIVDRMCGTRSSGTNTSAKIARRNGEIPNAWVLTIVGGETHRAS